MPVDRGAVKRSAEKKARSIFFSNKRKRPEAAVHASLPIVSSMKILLGDFSFCYYLCMTYPNNDLWSVRQIEFLHDALEGYANTEAHYYPNKEVSLNIPEIATYSYKGVLYFEGKDRTVIFEQGETFGLKQQEIEDYLKKLNITYSVD